MDGRRPRQGIQTRQTIMGCQMIVSIDEELLDHLIRLADGHTRRLERQRTTNANVGAKALCREVVTRAEEVLRQHQQNEEESELRRIPDVEPDGFRRYRRTADDPDGYKEHKNRCIVEVLNTENDPHAMWHQCRRYRGHGPGGEMCKQHAKLYEQRGKCDPSSLSKAAEIGKA